MRMIPHARDAKASADAAHSRLRIVRVRAVSRSQMTALASRRGSCSGGWRCRGSRYLRLSEHCSSVRRPSLRPRPQLRQHRQRGRQEVRIRLRYSDTKKDAHRTGLFSTYASSADRNGGLTVTRTRPASPATYSRITHWAGSVPTPLPAHRERAGPPAAAPRARPRPAVPACPAAARSWVRHPATRASLTGPATAAAARAGRLCSPASAPRSRPASTPPPQSSPLPQPPGALCADHKPGSRGHHRR